MSEQMVFPETWEAYERKYKITDREKVYTNGTELIPTYRVRQWLEHLGSKKNIEHESGMMETVAHLFGKNLGEKFRLKNSKGVENIYSFESCGLMWWNSGETSNTLVFMDNLLCDLMAGREVIVDD